MGLLDLLYVASMPVVKVLLISGVGATLSTNYAGVLTQETRKTLNKIVFMVFTPSLLFSSLVKAVTLEELISWWSMPINILLTFTIGSLLGWIVVKITKSPIELRGTIVSACCAVRVIYYYVLLQLGSIFIWTYAYGIIRASLQDKSFGLEEGLLDNNQNDEMMNSSSPSLATIYEIHSEESISEGKHVPCTKSIINRWHQKIKDGFADIRPVLLGQLKSPPNISVVSGLIIGVIPQVKNLFVGDSAPLDVIQDSISLLGDGTVPSIILVMGGNLLQGLKSSKLKRKVIPLVICVKFILMPLAGLFIVKEATNLGLLPDDPLYRFVLMIQYCVPSALNLGTIAQLFNVGEQECSVLLFWSYIVASVSLTFWSTVFMLILVNN